MASETKKKDVNEFVFRETVSDIPLQKFAPPRNLEDELFGKKGQKQLIADYEQQLGYKKKPTKSANVKFHNVILDPTDADDSALLNELMNDKEIYNIIKWSEFTTNRTGLQLFIVYSENLDSVEKAKKLKETKNEPTA